MDHKAYVLDYDRFERELAPLLVEALRTGSSTRLQEFVKDNLATLKDPDEGTPLGDDWQVLGQSAADADPDYDVQRWGDIALTRYYDPDSIDGLTANWEKAENALDASGVQGASVVLGRALAGNGRYFDPGLQGAYFQSPQDVRRNLELLQRPEFRDDKLLERWRGILRRAADAGKGLYVTF